MNRNDDPAEMLRQISEYFQSGKFKFSPRIVIIIALVIAALWILFTGLFTVAVDEVAVIQRFGKFNRIVERGLGFKLPDGIEKRTNVKIQKLYVAEFGMRTIKAGKRTDYAPEERYLHESLMLTGDLNCAVVPWIVQYRISDPVKYLFEVRDVDGTLRDLAEATMRVVVGDRSINEVITKRLEIADTAKGSLQKSLDEAQAGLTIVNVELKNTTVPAPVKPSFNEVNQALQQKEKMIYEAREAYNKVIPSAKGEAQKIISEAEGYALERVNRARGDSSRFVSVHNEYRRAPDVTRRRLYLEALGDVLPELGQKTIIDKNQKGVLPLLNLNRSGGAQ